MSKLSKGELKTSFALSSVVGLRMFGLFLIMPVFSAYALHLPGATPLLVGLAIGIYGFAQAALQVPVGLLSDRIGLGTSRSPWACWCSSFTRVTDHVSCLKQGRRAQIIGQRRVRATRKDDHVRRRRRRARQLPMASPMLAGGRA